MSPAALQLAVLGLLAAASYAAGRALVRALGLRRLQRLSPETFAVSIGLGAMAWTVGFGLLSGPLRLPARPSSLLLLAALLLAGAVAWWRAPAGRVRRRAFSRGIAPALALGGASVVTATLALLPVLTREGFQAGNDTYTYCALSESLQLHGFGDPVSASPEERRADRMASYFQRVRGYPLGGTYPLAMVQAANLAGTALEVYPAVSAFGLVLTLLALWSAARSLLRLPVEVALVLACAFALSPHAGYWAHHNGFLSQTYAVPGLLFALLGLSSRGLRQRTGFVVFVLSSAFLCFVYLPFAALAAVAAIVVGAVDLLRHRAAAAATARRLLGAALAALALCAFDVSAVVGGLFTLMRFHVSNPVRLGPLGMAAIALGPGPGAQAEVPSALPPGAAALTLCAGLLAVAGMLALRRERRAHGLLACLAVLTVLAVSAAVVGPTASRSWSLFKTAQWAFPLLSLVQAAGLAALGPLASRAGALVVATALALASSHAHLAWKAGGGLAGILDGERPLRRVDAVRRAFQRLPQGRLRLVGRPASVSAFRGGYATLFAFPRPLSADWEGSVRVQRRSDLDERLSERDVVAILADTPPFDRSGREDLGGGFARLVETDRPRLVQVLDASAREWRGRPGGGLRFVSPPLTKLVLFSPRETAVDVVLELEPVPGIEALALSVRVVAGPASGAEHRRALREAESVPVRPTPRGVVPLRITAGRGLTTLALVPARPIRLRDVRLLPLSLPGREAGAQPARPDGSGDGEPYRDRRSRSSSTPAAIASSETSGISPVSSGR